MSLAEIAFPLLLREAGLKIHKMKNVEVPFVGKEGTIEKAHGLLIKASIPRSLLPEVELCEEARRMFKLHTDTEGNPLVLFLYTYPPWGRDVVIFWPTVYIGRPTSLGRWELQTAEPYSLDIYAIHIPVLPINMLDSLSQIHKYIPNIENVGLDTIIGAYMLYRPIFDWFRNIVENVLAPSGISHLYAISPIYETLKYDRPITIFRNRDLDMARFGVDVCRRLLELLSRGGLEGIYISHRYDFNAPIISLAPRPSLPGRYGLYLNMDIDNLSPGESLMRSILSLSTPYTVGVVPLFSLYSILGTERLPANLSFIERLKHEFPLFRPILESYRASLDKSIFTTSLFDIFRTLEQTINEYFPNARKEIFLEGEIGSLPIYFSLDYLSPKTETLQEEIVNRLRTILSTKGSGIINTGNEVASSKVAELGRELHNTLSKHIGNTLTIIGEVPSRLFPEKFVYLENRTVVTSLTPTLSAVLHRDHPSRGVYYLCQIASLSQDRDLIDRIVRDVVQTLARKYEELHGEKPRTVIKKEDMENIKRVNISLGS